MFIRTIGLIGILLWQAPAIGQSQWATAGVPGQIVGLLRQVYANETRDTIYFAGSISFTGTQYWAESNSVMRYSNGQWDTLGVLNGLVYSVVLYNDTLITAGQFFQCSGNPCQGIAYHNGVEWQPYGNIAGGSIRKLRVLDGELYAVGGFNVVDGQPASGVAKRVGGSWEPVGFFNNVSSILDIAKYNGNVVVIGSGVAINGGTDIAEWDGEEWHLLGPGIINPMSGAHCLAVYQGDLYVGGQIAIAPGNPGQNIMRWDGTQFNALGQGVQQWLGNTTAIATVLTMAEHNGKLFVGGGFRAAGGIEAMGLASWDGTEWCSVLGDFQASGGVRSMDFYLDTLFVSCGVVLDGDSVNRAAKFIGEVYEAECSGPVGVEEEPLTQATFTLHPNPTTGLLHVALNGLRAREVFVADALGREVLRQGAPHSNTGPLILDLAPLSPGAYLVTVVDEQGMHYTQRVLRE
ncbi:MAG: T9SS type A sorting domain-containing protein [Flavobacteriales bacterium]|nr:T9SS type A sorting domain-containing protein [Flavobacteriales bacterium]